MKRARIVAAVFALTALIVGGAGAVEVWLNSRGWVEVGGEVVAAEVERRVNPHAREVYKRIEWVPQVTYTYTFGTEDFESDAVWAGIAPEELFYDEAWAREFVAAYPVGGEVTVHVDPDDPTVAALKAGAGAGWVLVGLGAALLVLAGVVVVRSR